MGDAVTGALVCEVGLAVALEAEGLGEAEVLVGAGDGGPKQPVSMKSAENPRTLSADSLGLAMLPPWVWTPVFRGATFKLRLRLHRGTGT